MQHQDTAPDDNIDARKLSQRELLHEVWGILDMLGKRTEETPRGGIQFAGYSYERKLADISFPVTTNAIAAYPKQVTKVEDTPYAPPRQYLLSVQIKHGIPSQLKLSPFKLVSFMIPMTLSSWTVSVCFHLPTPLMLTLHRKPWSYQEIEVHRAKKTRESNADLPQSHPFHQRAVKAVSRGYLRTNRFSIEAHAPFPALRGPLQKLHQEP